MEYKYPKNVKTFKSCTKYCQVTKNVHTFFLFNLFLFPKKPFLSPSVLMLLYITFCLSVCVQESYIVHHFNSTRLRCVPLTCIVKVTWVRVKGHMGQGEIRVPNKGRWAEDNVKLLHFLCVGHFRVVNKNDYYYSPSCCKQRSKLVEYWNLRAILVTQTEVQCTCSVVECTLLVHCYPNSVAGVYTAHAVYYTLQAALQTASSMYHIHLSFTAGVTLNVHFILCSVVAVYTAQSMQAMSGPSGFMGYRDLWGFILHGSFILNQLCKINPHNP